MQYTCAQCGHLWLTPDEPNSPAVCPMCGFAPPPDVPIAEPVAHYQPLEAPPQVIPLAPEELGSESADESLGELPPQPRRRFPFEIIFFLVVLVVLLSIGIGAVVVLQIQQSNQPRAYDPWAPTESPYFSNSAVDRAEDVQWMPAREGGISLGPARTEIIRAEFGDARGKDASGTVIISDRNFLSVIVRIENISRRPLRYRSWYGNEFDVGGDKYARIRLWDDAGREYPWVIFDDVVSVRWHTPEAIIEPGKSVEDVIIFDVPDTVDRAAVKSVRIELPAAAFERDGFYHFELPADMIEEFVRRPDEAVAEPSN